MSADRDAEILRYLSAISRDIGEFRKETNERLDRLEKRADETNERLDKMEKWAEEVAYQLKIIGRDILGMRAQIEQHDDRLRKLEGNAV
jgi:septal ring factor EnvC (AmiA/AmiB activator)